jgi:hypothetical protein
MAAVLHLVLAASVGAQSVGPAQPAPTKMLVVGDSVSVRLEPEADGESLGLLFKNMVVEVLARTPTPQVVDDKTDYWYKIRHESLEGWCFGPYLSRDLPKRPVDTFDTTADDNWFVNRFGETVDGRGATRRFNPDTFVLTSQQADALTIDDYRNLVKLANGNSRYAGEAWQVLAVSLLKLAKTNPENPNWAYFAPKISSRAFWLNGLTRSLKPGRENQFLLVVPDDLAKDPNFYRELISKGVRVELIYAWLPDSLKSNPALARAALRAKSSLIGSLPASFFANKDKLIELLRGAQPSPFRFLPVPLNQDEPFLRKLFAARMQYAADYPALNTTLQADPEIALTALHHAEAIIDSVPAELWQDKEFVHKAVRVAKYHAVWQKVQPLWLSDPIFKRDLAGEILAALPKDLSSVMWIPDELLQDPNFMYSVRKRIREQFPSQYCRDKSLARLKDALASRDILSDKEVAHLLAYPCPH